MMHRRMKIFLVIVSGVAIGVTILSDRPHPGPERLGA